MLNKKGATANEEGVSHAQDSMLYAIVVCDEGQADNLN